MGCRERRDGSRKGGEVWGSVGWMGRGVTSRRGDGGLKR